VALMQQERVISLDTDLAKEKINLARMTGLPPNEDYEVTDSVPFQAAPTLTLDDAILQAFGQRADLKAAEAQIRAAQRTLAAARDERLPSLSVSGDYGAIGENPSHSHGTFMAAASSNSKLSISSASSASSAGRTWVSMPGSSASAAFPCAGLTAANSFTLDVTAASLSKSRLIPDSICLTAKTA